MATFVHGGPAGVALLLATLASPATACFEEESTPGRGVPFSECATCDRYYEDPATYYQIQQGTEEADYQQLGVSCFAVIRFPAAGALPEEWVLFDDDTSEFIRRVSPTGAGQWDNSNPPPHTQGFATFAGYLHQGSPIVVTDIQCPDPVQLPTGPLVMFFNAKTSLKPGIFEVWRAESTDRGVTWANFTRLIRASADNCNYPYMPSVVRTNSGRLLMAVYWACFNAEGGKYMAKDEIRFFSSTNGVNWGPLTNGGQLVTFRRSTDIDPATDLLRFDSGTANRPRLVLDWNDPNKIHMFYAGYPLALFNPPAGPVKKPARFGAGMGHAESTNGGNSWENRAPLHLPWGGSNPRTYNETAVKPSIVKHAATGRKYRLYFEGAGVQGGFYAYDYLATNFPPPAAQRSREEAAAPDQDERSRLPVHVRSMPNPTTGETAVSLDFAGLARPADVELLVVDIQGRLVRKLWSGPSQSAPREITWDGLSRDGSRVATGRYLVQVRSGTASLGSHWITILR